MTARTSPGYSTGRDDDLPALLPASAAAALVSVTGYRYFTAMHVESTGTHVILVPPRSSMCCRGSAWENSAIKIAEVRDRPDEADTRFS